MESEISDARALKAQIAELVKIKEELEREKESTMQSWLDSKPLIDELETLKSGLEGSKNRSMSDSVVPELESELEITINGIRAKKEKESEQTKVINKISQDLDDTNREIEKIKLDMYEELRVSGKLKKLLWVKRQTFRRSRLTLRAVRLESEAFRVSLAETEKHISDSKVDETVEISQEEYYALTRKAKQETEIAEWRITVSMEQKLAAEASRNLALIKLKESYSGNSHRRSRRKRYEQRNEKAEERESSYLVGPAIDNRGLAFPEARAKPIPDSVPQRRIIRSSQSSRRKKKTITRKRVSILDQIRSFFKRSMTKLFG